DFRYPGDPLRYVLRKYNSGGTEQWAKTSTHLGGEVRENGLVVDGSDDVYASTAGGIKKLNSSGTVLSTIGGLAPIDIQKSTGYIYGRTSMTALRSWDSSGTTRWSISPGGNI